MEFADHFSEHAASYRQYRPGYPAGLYDWLCGLVPSRRLAWDAGTGNGQAALDLAARFERVVATDPSERQIAEATPHPRIGYGIAAETNPALKDASVDLVTAAQAMHWFDLDRFFAEVARVLRAGGVIAAWTYHRSVVSDAVDRVTDRFRVETMGPFWPPGREYVEDEYRTIPFPFRRLEAPRFEVRERWTARRFLAYLDTWSAVRRCRKATGEDPLRALEPELVAAWGGMDVERDVRFPLAILAGRTEEA